MLTTLAGQVTIKKQMMPPESTALVVRWKATKSGIGSAGFAEVADHASAMRLAERKAEQWNLQIVDQ